MSRTHTTSGTVVEGEYAVMIWMRLYLLLFACGCTGIHVVTGGNGSNASEMDKEVMKKFTNFVYREYSRNLEGVFGDKIASKVQTREILDERNDYSYIDLVTSFFWGQEKGVVLEVGALDGSHLSNSKPLLDLNWKRILVEGSPVYQQSMKVKSSDALTFSAAICRNNRVHVHNRNSSFHFGEVLILMRTSALPCIFLFLLLICP